MRAKTENAFTLIEVLAVVFILGILAAMVVPKVLPQQQVGNEAGVESLAYNTNTQVVIASEIARKEGKRRLVSFEDMKSLMKSESEDVHVGLAQDFEAGGLRRYCVLAYSDNSETYTKATPFVLYKGSKDIPCPVDTSTAIWRQ